MTDTWEQPSGVEESGFFDEYTCGNRTCKARTDPEDTTIAADLARAAGWSIPNRQGPHYCPRHTRRA